jgi:hypothetical protein
MNLYWVYDLPIWLFGLLSVAVAVAVGLGGFYATRKWVRGVHRDQHSHNDIVGFYLGAICLFYGITLGLLAVGTWEAYSDLDAKVGEEASALAALYRDVEQFSRPKALGTSGGPARIRASSDRCRVAATAARDRPAERRQHTGGSSDTLGQF